MKWLLRITITILVLFGVRTALGLGLARAHYESTPTFREWVHAQPVADEAWRASVPAGEVLARELPWGSDEGESVPESERGSRTWTPRLRMLHGNEPLLDVELEVVFELSREGDDESFEALSIEATRSTLDPDFHGVVVLSIAEPEEHTEVSFPEVRVDAFALAGAGELEFVLQTWPPGSGSLEPFGLEDFASPSWAWAGRFALGVPCPLGEPPAAGLGYRLGTSCHGGSGLGDWTFGGTSEQYSIELSGEQSLQKTGATVSTSAHRHVAWTWNDRTW